MAKLIVETTVDVYNPKDSKLNVERSMKFEVETTEQKMENEVLVNF